MRSEKRFHNTIVLFLGILLCGILASSCQTHGAYRTPNVKTHRYANHYYKDQRKSYHHTSRRPSVHQYRSTKVYRYSKQMTRQLDWNTTTSPTTEYYVRKPSTRTKKNSLPRSKKMR